MNYLPLVWTKNFIGKLKGHNSYKYPCLQWYNNNNNIKKKRLIYVTDDDNRQTIKTASLPANNTLDQKYEESV